MRKAQNVQYFHFHLAFPRRPNIIFSQKQNIPQLWGIKMLPSHKNKTFAKNVHNSVYAHIIFIQKDNKSSKEGPPPPPPPPPHTPTINTYHPKKPKHTYKKKQKI
jgi:hypothetical protein